MGLMRNSAAACSARPVARHQSITDGPVTAALPERKAFSKEDM
jgi:hypothetical protein